MQVVVEKSGQVRLVEPDDFRRFQVTVEGAPVSGVTPAKTRRESDGV